MYCSSCGVENPADARFCSSCGNPMRMTPGFAGSPGGFPPRADIPNYLIQAILVTIFCCLPTGIVSIVYAAQVNGKISAGDIRGAESASSNARTWAWISFGLGLAGVLIYVFGAVLGTAI